MRCRPGDIVMITRGNVVNLGHLGIIRKADSRPDAWVMETMTSIIGVRKGSTSYTVLAVGELCRVLDRDIRPLRWQGLVDEMIRLVGKPGGSRHA